MQECKLQNASEIFTKNLIEDLVSKDTRWSTCCPRCGRISDRLLALSRYADVDICDECGTDEAIMDYFGSFMPMLEWFIIRKGYTDVDK